MSQPDADFRFIPVEMAAQIGHDCNKDQVIVLSFDESCGMLATATWGKTPEDKLAVATAGEFLHGLIGGDMSRKVSHADFRHVPAAEAAARIDVLMLQLEAARDLIENELDRSVRRLSVEQFAEKWNASGLPFSGQQWERAAQSWLDRIDSLAPPTPIGKVSPCTG